MPAERAPYGGGQGGEGGEDAAGGGADAGRQGQDGRAAAVKQCDRVVKLRFAPLGLKMSRTAAPANI